MNQNCVFVVRKMILIQGPPFVPDFCRSSLISAVRPLVLEMTVELYYHKNICIAVQRWAYAVCCQGIQSRECVNNCREELFSGKEKIKK